MVREDASGGTLPYIYIEKILTELRPELLSAMHAAVKRELRNGNVDVAQLYRAFTRAAGGQCSNPVMVTDRCIETGPVNSANKRSRSTAARTKGLGRDDS